MEVMAARRGLADADSAALPSLSPACVPVHRPGLGFQRFGG